MVNDRGVASIPDVSFFFYDCLLHIVKKTFLSSDRGSEQIDSNVKEKKRRIVIEKKTKKTRFCSLHTAQGKYPLLLQST